MNFKELVLNEEILRALKEKGFQTPTNIQESVIPLVLKKKDIMAQAQTGSGKSAGFVLPILELWSKSRDEAKKGKIKALVLTPTRELAMQVASAFKEFGKYLPKKPQVISIVGGKKIGEQLFEIQKGCDVLVATSGRFLDVLSKKQMNLSHLEYFILDEEDKMLSEGFEEELELILEAIPSKRQNLMFSATYPPKMLQIASKITSNAIEVI